MGHFLGDLEEGKQAEAYVRRLFAGAKIKTQDNCSAAISRRGTYDLVAELDGRPLRIEVKFDKIEARTSNVAVEYGKPGGAPSGITATRSDLWVYVLRRPLAAYVCRVECLRRFVKDNVPFRTLQGVGDGNSNVHLYRSDVILPAIFYGLDGNDVAGLLRFLVGYD